MFKANIKHKQPDLFGLFFTLPERMKKQVKQSKEYYFYKLIFSQIDEHIFKVLYSEKKSRPNAPINVLVSALILMNHNNWTYEQLFKEINFNILVKIALGLDSIGEQPFSPATIFNFQNRLNDHYVKTGENLLEQVFDRLTEAQLKRLKIKTDIQRTDSFAAVSNIRNYSRIQLLVEVILRIWRVLSDEDQKRFSERFKDYVGKSSGQYIYSLKRRDFPKVLETLGELYYWIDTNLKPFYSEKEIFKIFERVYSEHFTVVKEKIEVKPNEELNSAILQSPDDLDAAYRKKNGKVIKGQTINVVETANPENKLNLITDIAVSPANKEDSVVLNERLEAIKEKTGDLEELHFDGAYGSESNDRKMEELGITGIQTGVRGASSEVEIVIEKENEDQYQVSCPYQTVYSKKARKRYKAEFDLRICSNCELKDKCPARKYKKNRVYYFTERGYLFQRRKKFIEKIPKERRKLRNNVEATIKEFTCKMPGKKLKVRGKFKTTVFAFTLGISINFGRIFRHMLENPSPIFENALQGLEGSFKFLRILFNFLKFYFIKEKNLKYLKITYLLYPI